MQWEEWHKGMSRTYSKEILEEYEALQEQRKLERQIRRWKQEQNALQAAGLDTSEATAKVREWNGKHKDFLEQTGLKADGTRTVVGNGYSLTDARRTTNISVKGEKRTESELKTAADKLKVQIEEIAARPSRWSGRIKIKDTLFNDGAMGEKEPSCDISLVSFAGDDTIIHELLHSCSISYDLAAYCTNQWIEEAAVEYLTQEFCNKNKIPCVQAYKKHVKVLRTLNERLGFGDHYEFAKEVFNVPIADRYEWLEEKVVGRLEKENVSIADVEETMEFLEMLKGGVVNE